MKTELTPHETHKAALAAATSEQDAAYSNYKLAKEVVAQRQQDWLNASDKVSAVLDREIARLEKEIGVLRK